MPQLGYVVFAGHRNANAWCRAKFIGVWRQIHRGIHQVIPFDHLAGVACFTPHNGHQRAVAHVFAVINRAAIADGSKQFAMLFVVHIWRWARILPRSRGALNLIGKYLGCPLGAVDKVFYLIEAVGHLPRMSKSP